MKKFLKPSILPIFTPCAGILGLALRFWLMSTGIDEKNLLVETHPAGILLFVLTALVMAVLFLCARQLDVVSRYADLFPHHTLEIIGCLAAAFGILCVNIRDLTLRRDAITTACLVLGLLAAVSLILVAVCRFRKHRPSFCLYGIVTLYLMLHLVSQYRLWSAESQLQMYFFPLLASVFLMLTAYHHAVLDARKDSRRLYVLFHQGALFCCLVSVFSENTLFYLTMSLWMCCSQCSLEPGTPVNTEEG